MPSQNDGTHPCLDEHVGGYKDMHRKAIYCTTYEGRQQQLACTRASSHLWLPNQSAARAARP